MIDASFFVSAEVHAREVELGDGKKHTLWFKQLPAIEFRRFSLAENSDDEEVRIRSIATLICASLCNEYGSPAITVAQAMMLTAPAMNAIVDQAMDVNGQLGKKKD
jgi:hypothetical protein